MSSDDTPNDSLGRSSEEGLIRRHLSTVLCIVGLALVSLSALTTGQASGQYVLSIYARTPLHVWLGLGGALLLALVLSFFSARRGIGLLLGLLSTLTMVSMPLIRGYYYLGGDPLHHLGLTKWLLDGGDPVSMFYPVTHLLAISINFVLGLPLRKSLMVLTSIFFLLFAGFTAVAVARINEDQRRSLVIGAFIAFLLVPIDWISVHLAPHPSTYAVLMTPMLVYFTVAYYRTHDSRLGVLMAFSALFFVQLHPQQALNFGLILGTIATVQIIHKKILSRLSNRSFSESNLKWIGFQSGILFLISLYYQLGQAKFRGTISSTAEKITTETTQAGGEAVSRSSSAASIGYSFEELVFRIYGVAIVISIIGALVGFWILYRHLRNREAFGEQTILYISIAVLPLTAAFFVFFVADAQFLYLRYWGVIIVLVSLVGAAGLARIKNVNYSRITSQQVLAVCFAVLLALAFPAVLPSPYILQSSGQALDEYFTGYDRTFEFQESETEITYTRTLGPRYESALNGERPVVDWKKSPFHFHNQSLSSYYQTDRYLAISSKDRVEDVDLYRGYRYTDEDLAYLEKDSNISRVLTNGEFTLYRINATGDSPGGSESSTLRPRRGLYSG